MVRKVDTPAVRCGNGCGAGPFLTLPGNTGCADGVVRACCAGYRLAATDVALPLSGG